MEIVDYNDECTDFKFSSRKEDFYGSIESKPEMEQTLFKLQDKYYDESLSKEERLKVWHEMFQNVVIYARSMVLQKLKNKTFLEPDEVLEKATVAAVNFLAQYITKSGFFVGASFGAMINFKVLESVYKDQLEEQTQSLNVVEDSKDTDLLDFSKRANVTPLWYDEEEVNAEDSVTSSTVESLIRDFLDEADEEVPSSMMRLKMHMFFDLVLKRPRNYHSKDTFIRLNCKSKKEIDLMNLVELDFYNRLQPQSQQSTK